MTAAVRKLNPDDARAYTELRREMLLDTPTAFLGSPGDDRSSDPAWIAERLGEREQAIFAAEVDGRLAAVAGVYRIARLKCRHRAGIWGVYTTPSHRGRGLSRAVMSAAIEHARGWEGVRIVALSVSAQASGAQKLYESLGFVAWGTEPAAMCIDGQDLDEVFMVLRL